MRKLTLLAGVAALLCAIVLQPAYSAESRKEVEARLQSAKRVLEELSRTPDQNVPQWLLERAYAVAVVPHVIKLGLIAGGRRGKGVLVVRKSDGRWSNPIFVNLTGGSFGFQFGVQATDVLLVFTSRAGVDGIVGGKVTLGADASVAAGPVGRQTAAATDVGLNAQVYSYSRASGLFAGVALDGSALTIDHRANELFYQRPGILAGDVLAQDIPPPTASATEFVATLQRAGAPGGVARAPAAPSPPQRTPGTSTLTTTQPTGEGVTTYPMEDPNPGAEPPL
jgi:lipid-binding SYLF domain-containing protein